MRIVLAANDTTFIYNLRREILKGLIAEGHEVSVMCQVLQFKEELEQMGCGVIDIETARQGKNPFKDIVLFCKGPGFSTGVPRPVMLGMYLIFNI